MCTLHFYPKRLLMPHGMPRTHHPPQVAKSVVGSSLAKSAIFGHDPNWGRIAAAAG